MKKGSRVAHVGEPGSPACAEDAERLLRRIDIEEKEWPCFLRDLICQTMRKTTATVE